MRFSRILLVLIIMLGLLLSALFLLQPQDEGKEETETSGMEERLTQKKKTGSMCAPHTRRSSASADPQKRKQAAKEAFLKRKKAHETQEPARSPRQLSDEEVKQIIEAEHLCAVLTAHLDNDDLTNALAEARKLIQHDNPAVRQRVCEALDWIGTQGLNDLALMMSDPDTDIANAATESFWESIEDLPDNLTKFDLLVSLGGNAVQDIRLAEALAEFDTYLAFEPIFEMAAHAEGEVREDLIWELEALTGESFDTTTEWRKWFDENREQLRQEHEAAIRDK